MKVFVWLGAGFIVAGILVATMGTSTSEIQTGLIRGGSAISILEGIVILGAALVMGRRQRKGGN